MAQIQMTEALSGALIVRLQAEYGQQAMSNFALDILLDSANAELAKVTASIIKKDEVIASLMERLRAADEQLERYKRADDPHRAKVMGLADKVKQRQGSEDGSNPHKL